MWGDCPLTSRGGSQWTYPENETITLSCNSWRAKVGLQYLNPECAEESGNSSFKLSDDTFGKFCFEPDSAEHGNLARNSNDSVRIIQTSTYMRGYVYRYMNRHILRPEVHCPIIIEYGKDVIGDCASSGMTFLSCSPFLELTDVNASYTLPGLKVDTISRTTTDSYSPPKVFSIRGLEELLTKWESVYFGDWKEMTSLLQGYNLQETNNLLLAITSESGPHPITATEFSGTDLASQAKVVVALESLWARSTSQLADRGLRVLYSTPRVVSGTLTDYNRRWVVQNEVSTRILQALYGVILVCLIGGFIQYRKVDKLLPFPPTSIGAVVKLLAGSEILGRTEEEGGVEGIGRLTVNVPSDQELKVQDGSGALRECRLGWWPIPDNKDGELRMRYGIDFEARSGARRSVQSRSDES